MESVNDLLIGSTAQVWRLSGGEGGVVTPDFCRAAVQLRVGCSRVDAEATDGGCVFVQRGGMRVKELGYSFEADGYRAADTTTCAEHAGGPGGFVGLAVQRVPKPWQADPVVEDQTIAGRAEHGHRLGRAARSEGHCRRVRRAAEPIRRHELMPSAPFLRPASKGRPEISVARVPSRPDPQEPAPRR